MIYTITLNPAVDVIIKLHNNDLKTVSINRAYDELMVAGGKGINVSRMLNILGTKSVAIGFTGGFTGKFIEEELKEKKIACDFVHLENPTRINVKAVADNGTVTEINAPSTKITQNDIMNLAKKFVKVKKGDIVVFSGTLPKSIPVNIFENFLKILESKKALVVVDISGTPLLKALKYHPFLVKPNKRELGETLYLNIKNDTDIINGAKRLLKMGAENVIVSLSKEGAIFVNNDEIIKIKAPNGKIESKVGAGDSLIAGFIDEYLKSNNFESALKKGIIVSNATTQSVDLADLKTINEVAKLVK